MPKIKNKIFLGILFFCFLYPNFVFAEDVVFDDKPCSAYIDWLDPVCTEDYVKGVYGKDVSCKTSSDDNSANSYFCYCVNFSQVWHDLYDCDAFLYGQDEFISFTQFEGELDNLQADDYDSALTRTDNARDYVSNVINFALTFLGFVAVIGIIYSGAQYLLAGDDTGKADKGKEGVKLISIGLILIMSSY